MAAIETVRTSPSQTNVLRANKEAAIRLPDPDEGPYLLRELPDEVAHRFRKFVDEGILVKVGQRQLEDSPGDSWVAEYDIDRASYGYGRRLDDRENVMPCGHSGFSNLRGEQGYTCGEATCSSRFDREALKRALDSGAAPGGSHGF